MSGLAIKAGLGLTKARFDEYRDGGGTGIHYDGNKVGGAPDIEYNLAVDYRKRLGKAGRIVVHGDFAHRGGYFTGSNNERTVDAHHLLNARAGFETAGGNWGLFFGIRNMTDQLYITGTGGGLLNTQTAWFGKPRTYTLKLSYRFSK